MGASPPDVARAYTVCRHVFDLDDVWAAIDALDNEAPPRLNASSTSRRDGCLTG